jgi:hypothetical protein
MWSTFIKSTFMPEGEVALLRVAVLALVIYFVITWAIGRINSAGKINRVMHSASSKPERSVSPGNPCPFLRSLVAHGFLNEQKESLTFVPQMLNRIAQSGDSSQTFSPFLLSILVFIANGLSPSALLGNAFGDQGLRINELRNGPLYKHGVSSRIIGLKGEFVQSEFDRLVTYASEKSASDGQKEIGLDIKELSKFMDDNFERAKVNRRRVYRIMMNGEWPPLLKVFGKKDSNGKLYLTIEDLLSLFRDNQLPKRMLNRLSVHGHSH